MVMEMIMMMVWVIVVVVIPRITPPWIVIRVAIGVTIIAVVAVDDSDGTILDAGEHMIGDPLARAGLLETINVVRGQDINDRGGAKIFENRGFADFVAAKLFDVSHGQHFAIEHFLFENRRDTAVLDFLSGVLVVCREKDRLWERRNL